MFPLLCPDPARDFDELFALLSEFLTKHGVPLDEGGFDAAALDAALRARGWHWHITDAYWDVPGDYHIVVGKTQIGPDRIVSARARPAIRRPDSTIGKQKFRPTVAPTLLALAIALEAVIRAAEAGTDNVMLVLAQLIGSKRSVAEAAWATIKSFLSHSGTCLGSFRYAQASTGQSGNARPSLARVPPKRVHRPLSIVARPRSSTAIAEGTSGRDLATRVGGRAATRHSGRLQYAASARL